MHCPACNSPNAAGALACATCGVALAPALSWSLPVGADLSSRRYMISRILGQGGFGITYLGYERELSRPVAIKEYFPHGCTRSGSEVVPQDREEFGQSRDRFLAEARIIAALNHPGIVQVYSVFEENRTAYIALEYLQGKSLQAALDDRGPLPEEEVVHYAAQVCEALGAAHDVGILHRDIKPANLFLSGQRITLLDFGAARRYTWGETCRMTSVVTPGYAPLEQYGQRARFGPYTDLYALGATIYHLVTGQAPPSAPDRAAGVLLRPPSELKPELSPFLNDLVLWAMQTSVDRRPQRASDFLKHLSYCKGGSRSMESASMASWLKSPGSGSGLARAAGQRVPATSNHGFPVSVSGRELTWPQECACCGAPMTTEMVIEFSRERPRPQSRSWEIPYCTGCLEHCQKHFAIVRSSQKRSKLASDPLHVAMAVGAAALVYLASDGVASAAVLAALCGFVGAKWWLASWRNRLDERRKALEVSIRSCASVNGCASVGPAVTCEHWFGSVHTFQFQNRRYGLAFRRQNLLALVSYEPPGAERPE